MMVMFWASLIHTTFIDFDHFTRSQWFQTVVKFQSCTHLGITLPDPVQSQAVYGR